MRPANWGREIYLVKFLTYSLLVQSVNLIGIVT